MQIKVIKNHTTIETTELEIHTKTTKSQKKKSLKLQKIEAVQRNEDAEERDRKQMNITIINTGGTFNKRYNPLTGNLDVPTDHNSLDKIISWCHNINFEIIDIISKDSLDIDDFDRQILVDTIQTIQNENIIIIHGTDTIDQSAKYLKNHIKNKKVIFTGAMIPMSIDETEATLNFSMALGFLSVNVENDIYLSMHGTVQKADRLVKNRKLGKFFCIR